MDIYAATSLSAAPKGAQYKTAQTAEKGDFSKIFNEVSFSKKQAVKPGRNDRKLQENYDSVLASSGMNYSQIRINDSAESVSEAEELVMGVSEDLSASAAGETSEIGNTGEIGVQAAFADITKAFSDMISTELLSQYIIKNYPEGTNGQNPMEEFSQKVSDIMFDAIEDRSGFTKTQMTNPNMTVDIIGLDKIADDDFIQEIADDIVSVVLKGDTGNKDLTEQIVKSAFKDIAADPARFVSAVNTNIQQPQEAPVQEMPEVIPQTQDIQTLPAESAAPAVPVAPAEEPVHMILMSDGTYIPEDAIMKSGINVPDEKGIYPAGTEYIEATPLIGKGNSPASAVLMAKVGDDDGLIRPSDFVKARNIVFTKHENVYGKSAPSVYMPINAENEAVSGVIEYNGAQSGLPDMSSGDAQTDAGADLMKDQKPAQNNDFALGDSMNVFHAPQTENKIPQNTEVFRVPPQARAEAIMQMTERVTNNLIQSGTDGVKQMQIQLQPETLGNIVIKLESVRGEVNVRIIASNPEVRDMIAQSAAQMGESIKASGVNLNNINVSSASQQHENFDGSSGNSAYYNDSQQDQRQQQEKTNYKEYMEAAENEKIRKVIDSIRSMGM